MSIHKSQGQTIDRVKVDLNKVFEKGMRISGLLHVSDDLSWLIGQAYVALSRATSLQGLEVLGFNPAKVGMAVPDDCVANLSLLGTSASNGSEMEHDARVYYKCMKSSPVSLCTGALYIYIQTRVIRHGTRGYTHSK